MDAEEVKKAPASFDSLPATGDDLKGLNFRIQASPLDCTGCGLCIKTCPGKKQEKALISYKTDEALK